MSVFHGRQSYMALNHAYFYTLSIQNFSHLLADDNLKEIVIESWQYLAQQKLVEIYGYVIMPNHLHLIWNILADNGKESPAGSFAKYTAHRFRKYLMNEKPELLKQFASDKRDRKHQFWKRDALAIPLSTEKILIQRLEYIHNNPLNEKWRLCNLPEEYRWSSARFYFNGTDEFEIVKHFKGGE
jgi:putative transposase